MAASDFFADFECGEYVPFSTSGESYDSDCFVNALCISNLLRTVMYSIHLCGFFVVVTFAIYRFCQLFKTRRHQHAFIIGVAATTVAMVILGTVPLSLLFNEHYGLRYLATGIGTSLNLIATTSVLFNWYQAQAASHFTRHADELIHRAYYLSWLSHVFFTLPFFVIFMAAAYTIQHDPARGNMLIAVAQLVGSGYAIVVVIGIWIVQKRLLSLIHTSLNTLSTEQMGDLERKIIAYARSQTATYFGMGGIAIAFALYGLATINSIWTTKYFFYFNQFFFQPGYIFSGAIHIYSTYDKPGSRNSSSISPVGSIQDNSKRSSKLGGSPKVESQAKSPASVDDSDTSMEIFMQAVKSDDQV